MKNTMFENSKSGNGRVKQVGKGILFFLVLLTGFSMSLVLSSCNKVDKPYILWTPPPPPLSDTIRKILLEDYTGHRCNNCPAAAYTIHNYLKPGATYSRQIIPLAIHPYFNTLTAPDTTTPYTSDFRTEVGKNYFKEFNLDGLPSGLINRKQISKNVYAIRLDDWGKYIDTMVKRKPDVLLKITNNYNIATRELKSDIKCSFLNTLGGNYNLVVLLTQDSILAPQEYNGNGGDIHWTKPTTYNYPHMHVLRDCIDNSGGSGGPIGPIKKGTFFTKSISYPLPNIYRNIPVVPKYCSVVAFVYNMATKEVVQAEDAKMIP